MDLAFDHLGQVVEQTVSDPFFESDDNSSDDSNGDLDEDASLDAEDLDTDILKGEGELEYLQQGYDETDEAGCKLGISQEMARNNYLAVGSEVEEDIDRITVTANADLMSPEVDAIQEDGQAKQSWAAEGGAGKYDTLFRKDSGEGGEAEVCLQRMLLDRKVCA